MIQAFNPACLDAFAQLLAQPDPKDLPRRAHVLRYGGEPDRRATRLPQILTAWLQRRFLEIDVEEPVAKATRTWTRRGLSSRQGLRLLRPTGTG